MKNKSTMLLVGIGVAYLIYRFYAKKSMVPIKTTASTIPLVNYPNTGGDANEMPSKFLVDSVRTAEVPNTPDTYQSFYGRLNGNISKVPSTC